MKVTNKQTNLIAKTVPKYTNTQNQLRISNNNNDIIS